MAAMMGFHFQFGEDGASTIMFYIKYIIIYDKYKYFYFNTNFKLKDYIYGSLIKNFRN